MTKTAQIAVARGIAESIAGTGVTTNSILAGPTESEGVAGFVEAMAEHQKKSKGEIEKAKSHMTRVFREQTGVTPNAFKRRT